MEINRRKPVVTYEELMAHAEKYKVVIIQKLVDSLRAEMFLAASCQRYSASIEFDSYSYDIVESVIEYFEDDHFRISYDDHSISVSWD